MSDEHERPHLDRGRSHPHGRTSEVPGKRPLQPGEKQPDHAHASERAQDTLNKLSDMRSDLATETMGPSNERAQESGNPNKTPPHERTSPLGPAQTAPADIAASHLAAAESAIIAHETAEEKINSDPRRERDQRLFELAATGKLNTIAPSDGAAVTAEDQLADDNRRLDEAEDRAKGIAIAATGAGAADYSRPERPKASEDPNTRGQGVGQGVGYGAVRPAVIRPGEQENAPPNNITTDMAGKQVGGAEGERIANEEARRRAAEAEASASGTVIK